MANQNGEIDNFYNSTNFKIGLFLLGAATAYLLSNQNYLPSWFERFSQSYQNRIISAKTNCNEAESIKRAKESVVRVSTDQGEGSGFVIKSEGYILTNYHVVKDSASPRVKFPDKTQVIGQLFSWDEKTDLAIIKVNKEHLKALSFGDSEELILGQTLVGIGFPLGEELPGEATVTKGTYSAKRYVEATGVEYIQVDANLNSGNSGSPVITTCGDVLGVITLSISGSEGLKFAISSKTAQSMSDSLIATGPKQFQERVEENNGQVSPETTVVLYYDLVSLRQLDTAWNLLSRNFQNYVQGYDRWRSGYDTTLNVFILDIASSGNNAVNIKLGSVDDVNGQVLYKIYAGTYTLIVEDGIWKIDKANISQIK